MLLDGYFFSWEAQNTIKSFLNLLTFQDLTPPPNISSATLCLSKKMGHIEQSCAGNEYWFGSRDAHKPTIWLRASLVSKVPAARRLMCRTHDIYLTCYRSSSPLLCNDYNDGSVVNSRVASLCCFVVGAFFLWWTGPLFVEKKDPGCFKGYDKAVCFACLLNVSLAWVISESISCSAKHVIGFISTHASVWNWVHVRSECLWLFNQYVRIFQCVKGGWRWLCADAFD